MAQVTKGDALCCSFCRKSQDFVGKLISSPSNYPRAYICDECIAVCYAILEDDRHDTSSSTSQVETSEGDHPLLHHSLASRFFTSVEQWMMKESLGADAAEELAQMRSLATLMLQRPEGQRTT
jgi:ClpX C4-type zinc finger protein